MKIESKEFVIESAEPSPFLIIFFFCSHLDREQVGGLMDTLLQLSPLFFCRKEVSVTF